MPQSRAAPMSKGSEKYKERKEAGLFFEPEGQTTTHITRAPCARMPKPSYSINIISFLFSLIFNLFGCEGS